jgi:hypothetical protein
MHFSTIRIEFAIRVSEFIAGDIAAFAIKSRSSSVKEFSQFEVTTLSSFSLCDFSFSHDHRLPRT